MAKSNYLELCKTVRQECGQPGSGPASVTNQTGMLLRITDWVANAAFEIEAMWADWNFRWARYTTNTILNTSDYIGPSDLGSWDRNSFFLDFGTASVKPLTLLDFKVWRGGAAKGYTAAARPSCVIINPLNALILYPTPDSASYVLQADYAVAPTRMSDNTDTSLIPEKWERIIVARAKMSYAAEEGAQVMYDGAASEYGFLLQQLQADQLPMQMNHTLSEGVPMVVRPL